MSLSSSDLKPADKNRCAAAWMNINNKKAAMAKVNWEQATSDIGKNITAESFKTSVTRMSKDYVKLSDSDKCRLAACFINTQPTELKSIMPTIDWNKAATDFKPSGKPIKSDSFKTSIGRLLSGFQGGGATKASGRKRKAADTDSAAAPRRRKKVKEDQNTEQEDAVDSASPETPSDGQTGDKQAEEVQNVRQEGDAVSDTVGAEAAVDTDSNLELLTDDKELSPEVKAEPTTTGFGEEEYYHAGDEIARF